MQLPLRRSLSPLRHTNPKLALARASNGHADCLATQWTSAIAPDLHSCSSFLWTGMIFAHNIIHFCAPTDWLSVSKVVNLLGRITCPMSQYTRLYPVFSDLTCSCYSDRMRIADCESLCFEARAVPRTRGGRGTVKSYQGVRRSGKPTLWLVGHRSKFFYFPVLLSCFLIACLLPCLLMRIFFNRIFQRLLHPPQVSSLAFTHSFISPFLASHFHTPPSPTLY